VLNNTKTQSRVAHFTVTVSHCHCQWQSLPVTLCQHEITQKDIMLYEAWWTNRHG